MKGKTIISNKEGRKIPVVTVGGVPLKGVTDVEVRAGVVYITRDTPAPTIYKPDATRSVRLPYVDVEFVKEEVKTSKSQLKPVKTKPDAE